MRRKEKIWCLWAFVVALVDIIVPFRVLRSEASLSGALAFWLALSVIVIISGAIVTASWDTNGRE